MCGKFIEEEHETDMHRPARPAMRTHAGSDLATRVATWICPCEGSAAARSVARGGVDLVMSVARPGRRHALQLCLLHVRTVRARIATGGKRPHGPGL
jgi:hypothetical protein